MIATGEKKDIRLFGQEELTSYFTQIGEKAFRAKQVYDWLWNKSATSFEEMTNLSLKTRELLNDHFEIRSLVAHKEQISSDQTIKSAFKLYDNHLIEGVLIPAEKRMTACISSQVGCSLSCKFCATGFLDRKRNLDAPEIYDQVVAIKNQAEKYYNAPLTNIVYMGMGEPLLNYQNVIKSVELITSEKGLGMSPRRITVSTAGIAKMIKKLGDDDVKFNLALSLHAANEKKRSQIMPINESNSLESLTDALNYFYQKTKNKITLEYIAFRNFNEGLDDAEELYRFAKKIPCKINIIEYNPIDHADFKKADPGKIDLFKEYLEKKGLVVNIRRSRGKDIDAACGQLANKN